MGGMMDRTAEEILDELIENGTMPSEAEVTALCEAVFEGEQAAAKLDALDRALRRGGWSIIDMTTDDDEGQVLELIPPDPDGA